MKLPRDHDIPTRLDLLRAQRVERERATAQETAAAAAAWLQSLPAAERAGVEQVLAAQREDLTTFAAGGPRPSGEWLCFTEEMADVVGVPHDAEGKVIHRDLTADEHAELADLGERRARAALLRTRQQNEYQTVRDIFDGYVVDARGRRKSLFSRAERAALLGLVRAKKVFTTDAGGWAIRGHDLSEIAANLGKSTRQVAELLASARNRLKAWRESKFDVKNGTRGRGDSPCN